jgi:hypothetical protein
MTVKRTFAVANIFPCLLVLVGFVVPGKDSTGGSHERKSSISLSHRGQSNQPNVAASGL